MIDSMRHSYLQNRKYWREGDTFDAFRHGWNASKPELFSELIEALEPFANYACDEPCDCHNCKARLALIKANGGKIEK